MTTTLDQAKGAARTLRTSLATLDMPITHSQALELIAHQLGYRDWNTAHAALTPSTADFGTAIPVIRVQDERLAREFYLHYLGFTLEWEHRFKPGFPVYIRARRDDAVIDLSEHHGDGVPGSVTWIPVLNVDALLADLRSRPHPKLLPDIDPLFPGGPTIEVTDPFGNALRLCQPFE